MLKKLPLVQIVLQEHITMLKNQLLVQIVLQVNMQLIKNLQSVQTALRVNILQFKSHLLVPLVKLANGIAADTASQRSLYTEPVILEISSSE